MAHSGAKKLPLRHPAEIPMFILMVVLNFAILAVLIDFLTTTALIPPALRGTDWEYTIRAVAGAIILVAPAILVVRQVQRASIRGTAVQLSRTQFPNGAALESKGELGLVLLTAGRYAADNVHVSELVDQGRRLGGFWVGIAQLPRSHPWTVRRIWRLHQLGLFGQAHAVGQAPRSQEVG